MCHIVFAGPTPPNAAFLTPLYRQGYLLTLAPGDQFRALERTNQPCLVVLALAHALDVLPFRTPNMDFAPHWLAWNQTDDPALSVAAYDNGALAVLPSTISPDGLLRAVQRALGQSVNQVLPLAAPSPQIRRYKRGNPILCDPAFVGIVERGQIIQTAIHSDGSETVLGFLGAGAILSGGDHQRYAVRICAHTDGQVLWRAWVGAAGDPAIGAALRRQINQQQVWAAAQGHPQIARRILGIVQLLAEGFGVPHAPGTLVDLRLTHGQLAAAVGATRSTVTRALGELRRAGQIDSIGHGAGERLWIPTVVPALHQMAG